MCVLKKAFQILQQVGRALMTPVAVLPAAGLLLRFGNKDLLNNPVMKDAGDIVFGNLPLIFAVGVAIGLAGGEGVAGLAAVIGYLVLTKTLDDMGAIFGLKPPYQGAGHLIDMGVFGGILIGLLAAVMYKRFYKIQLHPILGFFAGKRSVPIVTSFAALLLGVVFSFIWPSIQTGIDTASDWVMDSPAGPFFFGFIQRLLIPFGLHHIFQTPFYFTMGSFIDPSTGKVVTGDMARFFAGDPTAGRFMAGLFPYMIFGLPAAALAMIHEAHPERRKAVSGILISAGLTSMLTGITEPVEFSFLFVAPVLFLIHAVLAGVSFTIMDLLHVHHGYTFSGGLIDYVLNYGLSTNGWIVIPVGIGFGFLYYFMFRFAIRKWDLKTPGREEEDEQQEGNTIQAGDLAANVLAAFGGKDNIVDLDACITRLRVTVNRPENVQLDRLKALGAAGIWVMGSSFQAIFGIYSDLLKDEIKSIMTGQRNSSIDEQGKTSDLLQEAALIKNSEAEPIYSPLTGKMLPITDVPDFMFAEKLMGDGFAIEPTEGLITAPAAGEILNVFPTKHAIGMKTTMGTEILIHIGIDTVKLAGQGFEPLVKEGDQVSAGQPLLRADLSYIKANARSILTPIVFTSLLDQKQLYVFQDDQVAAGKTLVAEIQKIQKT
jgi:glucose-specific phosphotransferase system IIBC component